VCAWSSPGFACWFRRALVPELGYDWRRIVDLEGMRVIERSSGACWRSLSPVVQAGR
jgi:hypothetical protein